MQRFPCLSLNKRCEEMENEYNLIRNIFVKFFWEPCVSRGCLQVKDSIPLPFFSNFYCECSISLSHHVSELQKKVLVKVLQAARSGNDAEFCQLLQELRKNRKRKTRKSKSSKLGATSTPLHSPDYIMADDDYYCQQQQQQPQQQSPYQWVSYYKFL